MSFGAANLLVDFYQNIDIFFLIMIRLLGFFIILPILTATSIPTVSKIGLSVFMAYLVFLSGKVDNVYYDDTLAGYILLMAKEFMVGFILSYVVYAIFSMLYMVGQLVDTQIGFSMVSVYDPTSQIQVPITGNLFNFMMCAFLIQTGGLHSFIYGIFYSYEVIVPGQAVFLGNGDLVSELLRIIVYYIETGVKIALPIMGPIFILDVAMGLLVKTVPQMNVFVVSMPLKLFVGLLLMYSILPVFTQVYSFLFDASYREIFNVMRGLVP